MGSPATGLRVDAERNRAAIVRAAAAVFSRRGAEVSLDEVARKAGVGIATLYRRFPDRDRLIEAVFEDKMTTYAQRAEAAEERSLAAPWEAFSDYVTYILEEQARDVAFADVLIAPLTGSPVFAAQHRKALRSTILLVQRAKDAGVVRSDFDHSDLYMLTLANAGLVRSAGRSGAEASRRLCAYILDGFRTASDAELPPVPTVWKRTARA